MNSRGFQMWRKGAQQLSAPGPRMFIVFLGLSTLFGMFAVGADARFIVFTAPDNPQSITIVAPLMQLKNSPAFTYENTNKSILVEEDVSTNPESKAGLYQDKIIVVPSVFERYNSSLFNWIHVACKSAYAVALTYGEYDYGLGYFEFAVEKSFAGASCRAFTISNPSFKQIRAFLGNSTGFVSVEAVEGGIVPPVRMWYASGWFYFLTIAMAISSCAVATAGVIRIIQYFRATRSWRPQIATLCICLETIGAFIRFMYWALDPFGSRHLIANPGHHTIFRTFSFPFLIAPTVLLTFYWHETLSTTSLKLSLNVSKFRVPAYVICAVAFIMEGISWVWYLGDVSLVLQLRSINQIYYVIISLGMAIFYIVTAIRIFVALQRSVVSSSGSGSGSVSGSSTTSKGAERVARAKLRMVTIKLCVCAFSLIALVIIAPLTLAPFFVTAPNSHPGYLAFWFCLHTVVNIKSMATILAFSPPTPSAASKSTVATAMSSKENGRSQEPQSPRSTGTKSDSSV